MTEEAPASSSGGVRPWTFQRSEYPLRLRATYPSTKPALLRAVSYALRVAGKCNCPADERADIEIALREALANAVIHGNGYHPGKRFFVRCYGSPDQSVLVLVRDEGPGFDPQQVPDPREQDRMRLQHGRGLLLMRELMDYIEYRKNGREVLLFKAWASA